MTNEEIPATNGVSSVGEESTMEGVTNGEMETEEVGGEVTKAKEEKSIMEMIAAGDFDAEENAAPDDASTNDKSVQPTEEAVIKEEEKVSEVIQEASEEKSKEVSDEEKKEEQEGEGTSASAGDEVGSGDDDKYTKEDTPRRIFVKHIDRKKNADDIEDYFFDEYKDTGLEDVYTCTVYNARSQRRMFFGNVILTFDTEENAKKFLEMKLKNEEKMTWKRKLVRHTLAEVQKRREDRAASVVSNSGDAVNNGKGAKVVKAGTPVRQGKPGAEEPKPSKIVACSNFPTAFNCNPEVERYLRECHENVREVRRQGNKVLVTFKDQRSAERFVGLAYVKYRGCYIGRSYHKEEVKQVERRAEKRKIETATNSAPTAGAARPSTTPGKDSDKKSVQFKLKGIFAEATGYRDIKSVLEQEHGLDVKFVSMAGGEARVRLVGGSDSASEVVYRLARDQVTVNKEVLIPATLTKEEEAAPIRPKMINNKAKRERLPDWSDY